MLLLASFRAEKITVRFYECHVEETNEKEFSVNKPGFSILVNGDVACIDKMWAGPRPRAFVYILPLFHQCRFTSYYIYRNCMIAIFVKDCHLYFGRMWNKNKGRLQWWTVLFCDRIVIRRRSNYFTSQGSSHMVHLVHTQGQAGIAVRHMYLRACNENAAW